jgi:glutamate-1-semialdehyde 2,1-aminomutase
MEPINCNTGCIMPRPGYLEGVRELTARHGITLIFDEVITGFRVGLGGAQALLGVTPDLATFAKALAAGFPLAAIAGRAEIMEQVESKHVMHGGTYNANVMSIAAGIATLDELARDDGRAYAAMRSRGEQLMEGLRRAAREQRVPLRVDGPGPVFHPAFTSAAEIVNFRSFGRTDAEKRNRFAARLQSGGVRVTARGTWFLSTAHTDEDIEQTLEVAERVMKEIAHG